MMDDDALRAYVESMLHLLSGDGEAPRALRNECHRLLVAIDRDDRPSIRACVDRLVELAGGRVPDEDQGR
jgi:hypothetical protein